MALLSRSKLPPGGFPYREPSINWEVSGAAAKQPFELIVYEIQSVRINNPNAGLNPSFEACAAALDAYTCARLHYDRKWCSQQDSAVGRVAKENKKPAPCKSCGKRKQKA